MDSDQLKFRSRPPAGTTRSILSHPSMEDFTKQNENTRDSIRSNLALYEANDTPIANILNQGTWDERRVSTPSAEQIIELNEHSVNLSILNDIQRKRLKRSSNYDASSLFTGRSMPAQVALETEPKKYGTFMGVYLPTVQYDLN